MKLLKSGKVMGKCSKTCGDGVIKEIKVCWSGKDCEGVTERAKACNIQNCPGKKFLLNILIIISKV